MELEEAVSALRSAVTPIAETEICPLLRLHGRVAAEEILAPINVPPFPKSAMDGYAVQTGDVSAAAETSPVTLRVAGELLAGDSVTDCVAGGMSASEKGTCVCVMTGAPVPAGYDAVVRQEDTDCGEKEVRIFRSVRQWQNYCAVGEDVQKGTCILKADKKITRTEIGLLAGIGLAAVKVRRPARIGIVCTGSELTEPGKPLSEGKIYSSIGAMLSASLEGFGQDVSCLKIVGDDEKTISAAVLDALSTSDFVVTTGGVSVGKMDLLPAVLSSLGAKTLFKGVHVQPGTPTMASVLDGKVVLSLSGNPYAALVHFDICIRHALSVLLGCSDFAPEKKTAVLASSYEKVNSLRRLVRARFDGEKVYLPVQNHASSVIGNMGECNCYLDVPAQTPCKIGDRLSVWMMGE